MRDVGKAYQFYGKFLKQGDLVFDVGTSIGDSRLQAFINYGGMVIAIEPQKLIVEKLVKRFGMNKNLKIENVALGEKVGFSEMTIVDNCTDLSSLSEKWIKYGRFSKRFINKKKEIVPITTLDNLISKYGIPRFCKIDVEGYEVQVMKGLTQKIGDLSFEFHKERLDDAQECIEYLSKMGKVLANVAIGDSWVHAFPDWVLPDKLLEWLNRYDDKMLWGDIYIHYI